MELVRITAADVDRQAAFVRYVPKVFPTADFPRWRAAGEWTDAYTAYALIEHGEVVANASATRMTIILDGAELPAFQFGAVGTLPAARGRGLAAAVMRVALADIGDAPSFLFANEHVREFYPRFGFEPLEQVIYSMPWSTAATSERIGDAAGLDPGAASTLARIHALARHAQPWGTRFGARDYGRVASWYLLGAKPPAVHAIGEDVIAVSERDGTTLRLLDVLSTRPIPLEDVLPRLTDERIERVELGFAPDRREAPRLDTRTDEDAHCFIRNFPRRPAGDTRFPLLART